MNKSKDLAFYDPDDEVTCTVYSRNLTYVKKVCGQKGSRSGWFLLSTHPDDDNDDKIQSFIISDFVVYLIADKQHTVGVQVLRLADDVGGKEGNQEDIGDVGIWGDTYMV